MFLSQCTVGDSCVEFDQCVPEAVLESSISFTYLGGGITPVPYPNSTGWRVLPYGLITQILQGRMVVEMAQGDRQFFGDGECLLIPPETPHCITSCEQGTAISRWAHVRYTALDVVDLLTVCFTPRIFPRAQGDIFGELAAQLARLRDAERDRQLHAIAMRQALGFQLLAALLDASPPVSLDATLVHGLQRMLPVLDFVRDHFAEEITRAELARLANLSPTRFYVVFKHSVGMSPSDYLKQVRLKHAQRLLLDTDAGIAEIARASGYQDAFHFSRIFKATYGHAPNHYRRVMQEGLRTARWA